MALTRYRRAIEAKLRHVPLGDALALVMLYATAGSPKAEPAAVRWLARLACRYARCVTCGLSIFSTSRL
jgi:hypothetical protein